MTAITKLQLVSPDGVIVKELTKVHIQCDKPFTQTFTDILHPVNKVK